MTTVKLHLVGARTAAQIAAHAALVRAHQEAVEKAPTKQHKAPPPLALNFYGFSGRAVRLRIVDGDERDQISAIAAKEVGEDALMSEFQQRRNRDWVNRSLVEVTKEKELDEAALAKATWVKVTQQQLDGEGPMSAKALFTAKDMDTLIAWFHAEHLASAADLETIMGKAVEVVDD